MLQAVSLKLIRDYNANFPNDFLHVIRSETLIIFKGISLSKNSHVNNAYIISDGNLSKNKSNF